MGTLTAMLEEKDPFLKQHSERVANNSANFCEEFKIFDEEGSETIYYAGLLHDIGIIGVPAEILQKADPLTDEEMIWIKKHPVRGKKFAFFRVQYFSGCYAYNCFNYTFIFTIGFSLLILRLFSQYSIVGHP